MTAPNSSESRREPATSRPVARIRKESGLPKKHSVCSAPLAKHASLGAPTNSIPTDLAFDYVGVRRSASSIQLEKIGLIPKLQTDLSRSRLDGLLNNGEDRDLQPLLTEFVQRFSLTSLFSMNRSETVNLKSFITLSLVFGPVTKLLFSSNTAWIGEKKCFCGV